MPDTPREARVLDAVVTLVDSLLDDFDVVDLLTDLAEHCTGLLDVAAAGLLLADPLRRLHLMASTSTGARDLELFELQAHEGPCLDCYSTGEPMSVPDLRRHPSRWPQFITAATDAGFASVHVVPMRAAGTVLGALGLFDTKIGDLTTADQLLAQTLAHIASVAILQEQAPSPDTVDLHLRSALRRRIVVEQAKGFLRQILDISVEEAFTALRAYAHTHNVHLTALAESLMYDPQARPPILATMRQALGSTLTRRPRD